MNAHVNKLLHLPPLLLGGIAAILISSIAIASLAISAQDFDGVVVAAKPPEAAAAPAGVALRAHRCAECGVIESTRRIEASDGSTGVDVSGRIAAGGEIEAKHVVSYATTIRLRDGSRRVITDADPARWRPGERVTVIGGMQTPGR